MDAPRLHIGTVSGLRWAPSSPSLYTHSDKELHMIMLVSLIVMLTELLVLWFFDSASLHHSSFSGMIFALVAS